MRFAFSEEQLAFRDTVREMLEKECPASAVRAAWTRDEEPELPSAWERLREVGVLGSRLDVLDLVLPLEETGRAALPGPVVESAMVGEPIGFDGVVAASLGPSDHAGTDEGDAPLVPWADAADVVMLARGGALHALAVDNLELEPVESVDGARRLSRPRRWPSSYATLVSDDPVVVGDAFDRGALGTAAQLLGVTGHLLEESVTYAKERHQFGAAIGSFQAVKHHLANVALALEHARPVVYRAAYSSSTADADRSVHVSMAKAFASDAASFAARTALQVHGAIGYAFESDLHLWLKRAWALAAAWGDAAWHRRRVADAVVDA